jgi:hypothetical protein
MITQFDIRSTRVHGCRWPWLGGLDKLSVGAWSDPSRRLLERYGPLLLSSTALTDP